MRLRRAIEKAEENGELKYIDRYIPGACYDYDYGCTVKELISLIYYHLSDNDLIIVKKRVLNNAALRIAHLFTIHYNVKAPCEIYLTGGF